MTAYPNSNPWNSNATPFRGANGERVVYECPAGGQAYSLWGTDIYTDDSSVCTAAVHVGEITLADGGQVTIEIREGQQSYAASRRNGIDSLEYAEYSGSFVIVPGE